MTDSQKPHKTLIVDSMMITTFRACQEKYNKRFNQLLVSKGNNGAIGSGLAFHEAVAAYRLLRKAGRSPEEAFNGGLYALEQSYTKEMPVEFRTDPCPDERRSLSNLQRILEGWVGFEESQRFEYLYIEQSLGISLGSIERADCIWDIIYAGIIDAVVKQQGCTFVSDLKTTTMNLSQPFKDSFRLSQQFMSYVVGMSEILGAPVYGAMASLVWFQKEAKSGRGKALSEYFSTVPVTFTPDQLAEWQSNTLLTCNNILECMERGEWQLSFGDACRTYNGCSYKSICGATPKGRELIERMDFERMTWEPLEEVRTRKIMEDEL